MNITLTHKPNIINFPRTKCGNYTKSKKSYMVSTIKCVGTHVEFLKFYKGKESNKICILTKNKIMNLHNILMTIDDSM